MKLKSIYLILVLLGLITSCVNDRKVSNIQIEIKERVLIPNNDLTGLFEKIRPNTQTFKIHADSTYLIEGENGTKIYLPENCFIDSTGKTITDIVELELVEALSKADFIKTNLHTVSNGNPIVSEGMIFIDAKSKGKPVTLRKGKELQIEIPNNSYGLKTNSIKIFSGTYDTIGIINWEEIGLLDNKMIYLPLELFDFSFWSSFGFVRSGMGYTSPDDDEMIDSITFKNPNLEKTFIATREFEKRFRVIQSAQSAIGHHYSLHTTTVKSGRMVMDTNISKIYLDNLDKDLRYCDSLAYEYVKKYEAIPKVRPSYYGECEGCVWNFTETFKRFYEEKLSVVIQINYADIDLESSEARNKLLEKGLAEIEIDEILGAYTRQKKIIQERKDNENLRYLTTNTFKIAELGWINCDYFYNNPTAKEVKMLASIENISENQPVSISLVLQDLNMVLPGSRVGDNLYSFTGIKEPYTKLPIGKKAIIIALSYLDNETYYGISRIEISEKDLIKIEIKKAEREEINRKLKAL